MSLSDLTSLNTRLIASAVQEDTPPESETSAWLDGDEGAAPPSLDNDKPAEFKGWSTTDKLGFQQTVEWVKANIPGAADIESTTLDAWVNEWAEKWRREQGLSPTERLDLVPSIDELKADDRFINGALWLKPANSGQLPPLFRTSQEALDEDGNPTGEILPILATVDPLEGVQFIEETTVTQPDEFGTGRVFSDRDVVGRIIRSQLPPTFAERVRRDTGETDLPRFLERRGLLPGVEDESVAPTIPWDDLVSMVVEPAPRRGGGSSTRRDITFDRAHLIEQANNLWRSWFLEGPNAGAVGGIVDNYIREARAFWSGQGGQLDFDTFVRNKYRAQPRYQTLYRQKNAGMTEEQYLQQYTQPIGQLGLRDDTFMAEASRAAQSGASPTDQLRRVTRSSEFQNQGGFSRRLASTVAGLGAGARI